MKTKVKKLLPSKYREILFAELTNRINEFGFIDQGYGQYEKEVSEGFFHIVGACLLKNPFGFYIMIAVRDNPISDAFVDLHNEIALEYGRKVGNKNPVLIDRGCPTMSENLNHLVERNEWKEWITESEKGLILDIQEAMEIFETYGLSFLDSLKSRKDIYNFLRLHDYQPPITVESRQLPILLAWEGDKSAATSFIDRLISDSHELERMYWSALLERRFLIP